MGQRRKRIGILTSGGDSPGMNPAVRAVVRMALARGCIPYAIFEGWQGLVDGGDKLRRVGWEDVRGILSLGGTVIGTARCVAFRQRAGRLQAAYNMVKEGIDALVCCGGDGSLTGANLLREEWPGLVKELIESGKVTEQEAAPVRTVLTIVGLVGSIDNDMCATDVTIGANTSLHRICEALDSIVSTALSHQRAFVVEVMGRHCGWLALMAGIAVGADWVFLPERPPPMTSAFETWEDEICHVLAMTKEKGNRKVVVIVSEGAIDRDLKPISGDMVKTVLEKRLGLDTRLTTLGHIQRGGAPSAFDRYLATVQGARAVDAVLEATPETPSPMIGISQNKIIDVPLMEAVALTHNVAKAVANKDFALAMELRDPDFQAAYDAYMDCTLLSSKPASDEKRLRVGILNVGAPAGGMNAAVYAATRLLLNRGHTPLGVNNGFAGLVEGDVKALSWVDVNGWTTKGGSELGTNRCQPAPLPGSGLEYAQRGDLEFIDCGQIAYSLQRQNIQALLLVGGFEAYTSTLTLSHARTTYPSFCIPLVHLPATISNNVPGTDYSLGSDTALNVIVEAVDRIKLSAAASRKRVFIVEVQGGNCGYLATLGGLSTGATTTYIPEEGISLDRLQTDIKHLIRRYKEEDRWGVPNEGRIILRNESVSKKTYTTDVISAMVKEEGHGLFDSKTAVLGHLQQGGVPSPLDRIRAVRLAVHCAEWIEAHAFAAIEHSKSHLPAKVSSMENINHEDSVDHRSPRQISMEAEASKLFTSKIKTPLGHMQTVYTPQSGTASVIGIRGSQVCFIGEALLIF